MQLSARMFQNANDNHSQFRNLSDCVPIATVFLVGKFVRQQVEEMQMLATDCQRPRLDF